MHAWHSHLAGWRFANDFEELVTYLFSLEFKK